MKYFFSTISLIFCVSIIGFSTTIAQDFPAHQNRAVNDFAGVIQNDYAVQIEAICAELWQKTSTAVVVVSIPTIGDYTIEDYANRLYEKWGIGKKSEDKGVLLINAVNDRKIRIETGYGVEGILPDGLTGDILDNYVIPELRNGDYGAAYLTGVKVIAGIIAKDAGVQITGEITYDRDSRQVSGRTSGIFFWIIIIFLIVVTRGRIISWLLLFSAMGGGGSSRRGDWGGGFGGGFGGFGGGSSGGGGSSRSY